MRAVQHIGDGLEKTLIIPIEQNKKLLDLFNAYSQSFRLGYCGYSYFYLRKIFPSYNSQIIANSIYDAFKFRKSVIKSHSYPKKLNPNILLRKEDIKYDFENKKINFIYKPRDRITLNFYPSEKQLEEVKGAKVKGSRIVKSENFKLHLVLEKNIELPKLKDCKTFVGVDIGLNYIAVCSAYDGNKFHRPLFFKGGEWKHLTRRQRNSSPEKWEHLSNRKNEILHTVTKRIVEYAKQFEKPAIVLEKLKIKRTKTWNKWNNFLLSSWARTKLQKLIEYKANWEGIPVFYVSSYKTSKVCCYCGSEGEREGINFYCKICGRQLNADFNASVNLARTAFRRATSCDREAFSAGLKACGKGDTRLPETSLSSTRERSPDENDESSGGRGELWN